MDLRLLESIPGLYYTIPHTLEAGNTKDSLSRWIRGKAKYVVIPIHPFNWEANRLGILICGWVIISITVHTVLFCLANALNSDSL